MNAPRKQPNTSANGSAPREQLHAPAAGNAPREQLRAPAEGNASPAHPSAADVERRATSSPAAPRASVLAACAYPVVTALAFPQRIAGVVFDFGLLCAWLSPLLLLLALRGLPPRAAARRGFLLGLLANAAILHFIAHTVVTYGHAPLWLGALAPFALASYAALTTALFAAAAALLTRAHNASDAPPSRNILARCFARARRRRRRQPTATMRFTTTRRFVARAFRSHMLLAVTLAALWVALDHLRSFALGGFPWATLGYAQHENAPLLGLVPWTGVYGLSFVTVWVAALLLPTFDAPRSAWSSHRRRAVLGAGVVLLLCHLLGAWLAPARLAGPTLRVAVLQGNIAQGVKWAPDWAARTLAVYENLARAAAARGAQVIVFPETALPGTLDLVGATGVAAPDTFRARMETLARETGAVLAVGAVGLDAARAHDANDSSRANAVDEYALYDSAFVFSHTGALAARYDKTHLVPFGEYLPLRAWLESFARPLATGLARRDVTPGRAPRALTVATPHARNSQAHDSQTRAHDLQIHAHDSRARNSQARVHNSQAHGAQSRSHDLQMHAHDSRTHNSRTHSTQTRAHELRLGVPICYELLFPNLVRRMPKDGARLLLGITNDAWYGATGAPYQFLAMTALRAAENGVWLARAANTGVSAFVDERGRVRERTKIFERGFLVATLRLPEAGRAPTFYAQHGDVFAIACWLLVAAASGVVLLQRRGVARQPGSG